MIKCEFNGVKAKWPSRENQTLNNIELPDDFLENNVKLPIMGPSGQGKSTLLYLIAALKWPSEGTITWTFPDGKTCCLGKKGPNANLDVALLRRKYFGFAFQDNTLSAHLTVAENIAYPLVLKGETWKVAIKAVEEQLKKVLLPNEEISDFMTSFHTKLSGGQQQRVALAQAMIHEPWVLFADEPTGQLDYHTRIQVMKVLKEWTSDKEERRLIWVTHHHTDDLDIMGMKETDKKNLLFVENGDCKLQDRLFLENWKKNARL